MTGDLGDSNGTSQTQLPCFIHLLDPLDFTPEGFPLQISGKCVCVCVCVCVCTHFSARVHDSVHVCVGVYCVFAFQCFGVILYISLRYTLLDIQMCGLHLPT